MQCSPLFWYYSGTPLYLAAKARHSEIVSLLMKYDADLRLNKTSNRQKTVLQWATEENHIEIVKTLTNHIGMAKTELSPEKQHSLGDNQTGTPSIIISRHMWRM